MKRKTSRYVNSRFNIRTNKGQSLTEFVFILPILFLVVLVIVQFAVVLEKHLATQKSVWMAVRGYSMVKYFVLQPVGRYKGNEVKQMVKENFFSRNDTVTVDFTEFVVGVKANISCKTPFLFRGTRWQALLNVFKGIVKDNKIEVKSEGIMGHSPAAIL